MRSLVVIALTLSTAVANAGEPPRFALAVNNPAMWYPYTQGGKSLAISGYVGVSEHVAIRANVASYAYNRFANFESLDSYDEGRTTDYGLGVALYSRHRYVGAFAELGGFRRSTPSYHDVNYEDDAYGWKLEWAGRVLAGYSWELGDTLWIAAAAGLSVGHETGDDRDYDNVKRDLIAHTHTNRIHAAGEWMFRIGAAF
jgi:hypothetical protein